MQTVLVDDSDVKQLAYAGKWSAGGSAQEYKRCVPARVVRGAAVAHLTARQHDARDIHEGLLHHLQIQRYALSPFPPPPR